MSGKLISNGLSTNDGLKLLDINEYLNQKIKDLTIHVIPLPTNDHFRRFQYAATIFKMFTPMIINPSLTHVAIQLNLEHSGDILIIEYGEYITTDSNLKSSGIFGSNSSDLSREYRKNKNENIYYYINKDGARITLFKYTTLQEYEKKYISISDLIAIQYYEDISLDQYIIRDMNFLEIITIVLIVI